MNSKLICLEGVSLPPRPSQGLGLPPTFSFIHGFMFEVFFIHNVYVYFSGYPPGRCNVLFFFRKKIGFSCEKPEGPCKLTRPLTFASAKIASRALTLPGKWRSDKLALLARVERGYAIMKFFWVWKLRVNIVARKPLRSPHAFQENILV